MMMKSMRNKDNQVLYQKQPSRVSPVYNISITEKSEMKWKNKSQNKKKRNETERRENV